MNRTRAKRRARRASSPWVQLVKSTNDSKTGPSKKKTNRQKPKKR